MTSLTRTALILGSLFGMASAAQAVCPRADNAALGFNLRDSQGTIVARARKSPGGEITTFQARGAASPVTYRNGLFPSGGPEAREIYEYKTDLSGFQLKVGESMKYEAAIRASGKPDRLMKAEIAVVGETQTTVGACTYPVFVLKRTYRYDNNPATTGALILFSGDLGVLLRSRVMQPNGTTLDFSYSEIESETL